MQERFSLAGFTFSPIETQKDLSKALGQLEVQISTKEELATNNSLEPDSILLLKKEVVFLKIIMESLQHEFTKKELRVVQSKHKQGSENWKLIEQQICEVGKSQIEVIMRLLAEEASITRVSKVAPGFPEDLEKR